MTSVSNTNSSAVKTLQEAVWQVLDDMNCFRFYGPEKGTSCCIAAREDLLKAFHGMGWVGSDDEI